MEEGEENMALRAYTIETRLKSPLGSEIREYLDSYVTDYSIIFRRMWQDMTSPDHQKKYPQESKYITKICQTYGILKRTANSINNEIKGRKKAYMELKKTEANQLKIKITAQEEKIEKTTETIQKLKGKVTQNQAGPKELEKYRKAKNSLYHQKNKLNKMKQRLSKLQYIIKNGIYSICFGSKRMFLKQNNLKENGYKTHEKWKNDFVKARDKNIFYLGSSDEACGNQLFHLTYDPSTDRFQAEIRKEYKYCKSRKKECIKITGLQFKNMREELIKICKSYDKKKGTNPLSFRFCRRGTHWYLQVIFKTEVTQYETTDQYGTIGLDYNNGFIELSETDQDGNLVGQKHFDLNYHGTGNKACSEIEETVSKIVNHCRRRGKDLVIENLDFKKTKAIMQKSSSAKGKGYRRMLHAFDYSRYKTCLENCCHKKKVNLILISPYMTSKIGEKKYGYQKKLNIHQAASYVIARKGQGFKDKMVC